MASVSTSLKQGDVKTLDNPFYIRAIGGDNDTPFYLYFPTMPLGRQWVYPFTYNFMYPTDSPGPLNVDTRKVPPSLPAVPTTTNQAVVTAYDTPQDYNPGRQSGGQVLSGITAQTKVTTTWDSTTPTGTTLTIACGGASAVAVQTGNDTTGIAGITRVDVQGSADDGASWIVAIPVFVLENTLWFWRSGQDVGNGFPAFRLFVPTAGLTHVRLILTTIAPAQAAFLLTLRTIVGALTPQSFGQQPMSQSLPVVLASDQSPFTYKNRVTFAAYNAVVATVNPEVMMSLIPVRAGVAGGAVTTIPVTAGKRLKIVAMAGAFRNNAAAVHYNQLTLRTNPAGAVVIGSPALVRMELYAVAALALTGQQQTIDMSEGLEFAGTDQIGISHFSDTAAIGFGTVSLLGFEYTP